MRTILKKHMTVCNEIIDESGYFQNRNSLTTVSRLYDVIRRR